MYVRHIAWLSVVPDKGEKPRRELYSKGHPALDVSDLEDYELYLVQLWHEAGTVSQGGMGLTALSWNEVDSWANRFFAQTSTEYEEIDHGVFVPTVVTCSTLLDWEIQTIHQLSKEYASEYSDNDPLKECPKEIYQSEVDSLMMSNSLGDAMERMFMSE